MTSWDTRDHEHTVHSAGGEDGIISKIFEIIGIHDRYFVEFGCSGGKGDNTQLLSEQGWTGLKMDCDQYIRTYDEKGFPVSKTLKSGVFRETVKATNINHLFDKYKVRDGFDFLSIDIDSNDLWVWLALKHKPRVVCIEYNAHIPPPYSMVIQYDNDFKADGTQYFGASYSALLKLGYEKGYRCIGCDSSGSNMFFVRGDQIPFFIDEWEFKDDLSMWQRPNYNGTFHPPSKRRMIEY